jgi:hypothetical protein
MRVVAIARELATYVAIYACAAMYSEVTLKLKVELALNSLMALSILVLVAMMFVERLKQKMRTVTKALQSNIAIVCPDVAESYK